MDNLVDRLNAPLVIEYAVPGPVIEVLQTAANERGEAAARIEELEAQNGALRRKLAEHGVTLIDNVDDHLAALTSTSKALSTGGEEA